ncbi:hypothetical protein BT96DRAFT_1005524 [Gymnopus androsaceus JB14]|uniref:Uncharacterized protein n=1 Tax=Gymnopus androsaceus JB14 TaxID=1447944 RepID=A0A6A4GMQ9_9AGAR|nr:hypothetical protein BT96DRAFT_1005524 [Gymnopus androsaceus JB14]
MPFLLPYDPWTNGEVDFLAVLDQTIVKTHSVLKCAKSRFPLLIITSWTTEELFAAKELHPFPRGCRRAEEVLFTEAPEDEKPVELKTNIGDTVVNCARLGSWHYAAQHILFSTIFTTLTESSDEELPHNTALCLERPQRTFLADCTVNCRLTLKEYDINV